MYKIGTMFHGRNNLGNIWIVCTDNSNNVALMFNGTLATYCLDLNTTRKSQVNALTPLAPFLPIELATLVAMHGPIPQWAQDLCNGQAKNVAITLPSTSLSPAVLQKVAKALDIDLTPSKDSVILRKDEDKCPINGYHRFIAYTGLLQSFEFCQFCDKKREIEKE